MLRRHELPDGRGVHYDLRRTGPPGAPVVVFLSGLSQTTVAWGLQVRRLRGLRTTLAVDLAGQGRSDRPPEGHRPADAARDLLHLLDALGVRVVDLVGFSYGGRVALRTALAAPDRVRRMVLAGCAHRETVLRRWMVQSWLDALDRGGLPLAFQVVTPVIVGEAWLAGNEHSRAAMLRAFEQRNTALGLRRLLADNVRPGGDLTEELRALRHPTLVLRGADDLVVPAALARDLVARLPRARLPECPGAGHTVHVEHPEWFAARLADHLLAE